MLLEAPQVPSGSDQSTETHHGYSDPHEQATRFHGYGEVNDQSRGTYEADELSLRDLK